MYGKNIPSWHHSYNGIIDESINTHGIKIFTDDSKINKRVGGGAAIYDNEFLKEEYLCHLPRHATVFQAELVAILNVLELSKDVSPLTIIIHGTSKP